MACSPSAEAAHGPGQGILWFRICLQQTQVVRAWLGTSAKKDREACCSPRSAHKLSKKKKRKKNLSEDCLFWQESNWPGENNIRQPFPVCWKQEGTNISNPFQKEIDTVSAFCSYLAAPCIIQSSTPAWGFGGGSEHVCEQFFQHPSVRIQPPLNSLTCIQTKPVSLRSGGESTLLFCSLEVCWYLAQGWGGCLQTPCLRQNTQSLSKLTELIGTHPYKDGYSSS